MSDAPWLDRLIELEGQGFREVPGPASNKTILRWARGAAAYPDMVDDSTTPWCGIGLAGILDDVGRGRYIPSMPARARNWAYCGVPCDPRPGAIVTFPRAGGNHVTVIRSIEGVIWHCVGCNQSNRINTTAFDSRLAQSCRWPGDRPPARVRVNAERDPEGDPDVTDYGEMLKRMTVRPEWQGAIDRAARKLLTSRERYEHVASLTGVPWAVVAIIHERESSGDFAGILHNGERIIGTGRVTSLVPRGKGPFETWEEAAVDALRHDGLTTRTDWSLEGICDAVERYNGLGYRNRGTPSPYLWSGTNLYVRGKFLENTSGSWYDAGTVDRQVGVIPLYLRLLELAGEARVRTSSRKLGLIAWVRRLVKAIISSVTSLFSLDNIQTAREWLGPLQGLISPGVFVTLILTAGLVWLLINILDRMIMEDAADGRYTPSQPPAGGDNGLA